MTTWARYLTPAPAHYRLGLVCLGVGASTGRLVTTKPRTLDCYAGVFVSSGAGWLRCRGGGGTTATYDIKAPAIFWLLPGVQHSYAPDAGGWNEWWVLFDGEATRAYIDLGCISPTEPVVSLADPAPLELAFSALARACGRDQIDADLEAAAEVHVLLATVRRCARIGRPDTPILEALLRDACTPRSVAEHARELGMSLIELRHAVRRAAGCSPKEYILRARLNRAKDLLATTDLTATAIARHVGYDDPAYFSRLFANRTGMPPSRFRTEQRRGASDPWD